MNYSKEDYETLKKCEDVLYTACYCQFVRMKDRQTVVELDTIYKKTFNTDKGLIGGCQHCLYEGCKKLGKLYFEDKKAYENAEKQQKTENEPVKEPKKASTQRKAAKNNNKKK